MNEIAEIRELIAKEIDAKAKAAAIVAASCGGDVVGEARALCMTAQQLAFQEAAKIARGVSAKHVARCPTCERRRHTLDTGEWAVCRNCDARGCDDCIPDEPGGICSECSD